MKCSGCNNEIPDDAKICPTCGRSFDKVKEFNSAVNSIIESADSNEAAISALILSVLSMFKATIIFAPICHRDGCYRLFKKKTTYICHYRDNYICSCFAEDDCRTASVFLRF